MKQDTTQAELYSNLDRQLDGLQDAANQVNSARRDAQAADEKLTQLSRATTDGSSDGPDLKALGIFALVLLLLIVDGAVAAPALADRFASFGIPEIFAWLVAAGTSVLIMFAEMLVALAWFGSFLRSLDSRRYEAVIGWTVVAALIMAGPILLSASQLLIVTQGDFDDPARMTKEISILLLFSGAHCLLVSSGRYLEKAKREAADWLQRTKATFDRRRSNRKAEAAHNELMAIYRAHLRSVQRGLQNGLIAQLGPFEDATRQLIAERDAAVDSNLKQFAGPVIAA